MFILVTMKYVWPPLTQAMAERQKRIADGLAAGEQAQRDLDEAKAEAEKIIKDARDQASQIREQATVAAAQIKEQAKADAQAERERQVAAAQAEIEQNANKAREELAGKVALLAISGAERLLEREVDADAHRDLLDKLAGEI